MREDVVVEENSMLKIPRLLLFWKASIRRKNKKSFLSSLVAFFRASIVSKKFFLSFCFFKASKVKEDIQRKQGKQIRKED